MFCRNPKITCTNGPLLGEYLTLQQTSSGLDGSWSINEVYILDAPSPAPGSELEEHNCYKYGVKLTNSVSLPGIVGVPLTSMRKCQEYCQSEPDCVSFHYKPNVSKCYPKSAGVVEDSNFERNRRIMTGPKNC